MSKVWLITGCSRGLGREIAQAVLAAGHRLVATARALRDLDALPPCDRLRTIALDVTDADAARAAVAVATSAFQRLDVVVNNAGAISANSIEDQPEDDFRRQIEINFFGVYNVTRAALPVMRTDMFGLSMLASPLAPDYEATVGAVIRATFGDADRARGNPAKVAQAILRLAEEEHPPLRLLLGSDAVALAADAAAARATEDEAWRLRSVSTDDDSFEDHGDR